MALKDNLGVLVLDQPFKSAALVSVVGLAADPSQVLVSDGSSQWSVSCLAGYQRRKAGDVVLAVQLAGGDWLVVDKIGADPTVVGSVKWGTGAPSASDGLRRASQVWVGQNADGTTALYTDMTTAAPAPVTVTVTDAGTWVGSSGSRSAVVSSDTQVAAWYYGGAIAGLCAGKSVTSMRVTVTRVDGSGPDEGVPLRLGLHAQGAFGQPTVTNVWDPQVPLWPGQTVTVDIPAGQVALLANGTAQGLAAASDVAFCEYAATAPITITFG
jgi:hypothetical protein